MTTKIILVLIFVCFIQMTSLALAAPKAPPIMPHPEQPPTQGEEPVESNNTNRTKQQNNDNSTCEEKENCTQYYRLCGVDEFRLYALIFCRKTCNLCSECVIPKLEHPSHGNMTLNYTKNVITATYNCDIGYYPSGGERERTCSNETMNVWKTPEPECLQVLTEKCNGSTKEYCNRVPRANCSGTEEQETCECTQGFVHSNNKTTCIEVYGHTSCEYFNSTSTCQNLDNSVCRTLPPPLRGQDGRCECKEGFSYNQSTYSCVTVLNNHCTDNSTCSNNSKEYGKVENSYCDRATENPVCKCIVGFAEDEKNLCVKVLNNSCTKNSTCDRHGNVENSYCDKATVMNQVCKCKAGFAEVENLCVKVLNNPCAENSTCNSDNGNVENSYCDNATVKNPLCKCKAGFAEVDNLCVKVLNNSCINNTTCYSESKQYGKVENSYCDNSTDQQNPVCKCKDGFAEKENVCAAVIGSRCNSTDSEVCNKTAYAECSSGDGKCQCISGFFLLEHLCTEVYLRNCTHNDNCTSHLNQSKCNKDLSPPSHQTTISTTSAFDQCICNDRYYYNNQSHSCDKGCGLPIVANASFNDVSNDTKLYRQGVNITYKCKKGYEFKGFNLTQKTITCTGNGTFNTIEPCSIKHCKSPIISNGSGNATNNVTTYNSTALYTCNIGYKLVGNSTSRCNESGEWENVPSCKIKDCKNVTKPTDGKVDVFNGTVYESVATFSCNEGYTLNGTNETRCTANGTWTEYNATCIINDCKQPTIPDKGSVNTTNGTTYKSLVSFSCHVGFDLEGETYATCLSNSSWNTTSPTCKIKDCGSPNITKNGHHTLNVGSTVFNQNATYTCYTGYETVNETIVSCNASGKWSHSPPECYDIDECARYTANCHSRARCTNTNGSYTCECYGGFKDISSRGQNGTECQDIDECSNQSLSNCSSVGSDCINFQGGYFCRCNIGWTGEKCDTDIDECNVTSTCGKKATCKNSDGGYNCTCNAGYPKGDPKIHCYQEVIIKLETQVSPSRGDNELIASKPIHYRFPYFDDEYSTFRPNMDGFLSLGYQPIYEAYGPESSDAWKTFSGSHTVVAPFWTNIDTTNLTGGLYTHLFEKYTDYGPNDSQHRDLSALGKIISINYNLTDFEPRVAIVATWLNVTKSSYIEPIRLIKTQNATMQVILISDGVYSYLMFNYDHEQWSLQKDSGIPSSAGYSLQDKTGYIIATSANFSQLNNETNTGLNGRWIYNVSSNDLNIISKLKNESECLEFRSNETIKEWIKGKRGLSYPCPCSQQQMDLDYSYQVVDPWYKKTSPLPTCYEAWFFNNDGVRQTCCYSYGALKKDTGGGFATFENAKYNIAEYFYKCCDENTDRHLCHLFYEMNPSDDCTRFQPADEPVQRKRRFLLGNTKPRSVIIELETKVDPIRGDNELIAEETIHYRFPYFDEEYSTFRPNMDGFLSFGYQPIYEAFGPESSDAWQTYSGSHTVVAPFWTNLDTTNLTGGLYTHLLEKYTDYGPNDSQQRDLSALGKIFSDNYHLTDFKPRVAIVATWLNVTKSSNIEPISFIKTQNATMQVILISDGIYSYLMFNYDHDQWSLQKDDGIPSSAGYSLQDKTGYIIATSANFSQLNKNTNIPSGLNGRWIYNVSSNDLNIISKLKNESECLAFSRNKTIKDWITKNRGLSYPCPCSQQQMDLDYSYQVVDPWYKKTSPSPTCYEAWVFNNDGVRQTCCYSYGVLKKDTGSGFATFEKDPYNVVDYFYKCCDENTDRHLCHLFYEMNPSDDCTRFQP